MPKIDEAIERAAKADKPSLWSESPHVAHMAASPYKVENERRNHLKRMRLIISAFLADVPVSDGMRRKGANAFMDGGGDSRFADAYKAMSAKLAKEIQ